MHRNGYEHFNVELLVCVKAFQKLFICIFIALCYIIGTLRKVLEYLRDLCTETSGMIQF